MCWGLGELSGFDSTNWRPLFPRQGQDGCGGCGGVVLVMVVLMVVLVKNVTLVPTDDDPCFVLTAPLSHMTLYFSIYKHTNSHQIYYLWRSSTMRRIPGMSKSLPFHITGGPHTGNPNASKVPQPTRCIRKHVSRENLTSPTRACTAKADHQRPIPSVAPVCGEFINPIHYYCNLQQSWCRLSPVSSDANRPYFR